MQLRRARAALELFAELTLPHGLFGFEALQIAGEEQHAHKVVNRIINVTKYQNTHEQACHCKTVAAEPVQISLCGPFAHEKQNDRAAIERRHWQQIERTQQQV